MSHPLAVQDLHVSEYVLSNELVSMALAMVAESHFVNSILAELFTVGGSELYIHPAARYLQYASTQLAVLQSDLLSAQAGHASDQVQ